MIIRKVRHGYAHWCPGCKHAHTIYVTAPGGYNWTFNGDIEKPTFTPSLRHFWPAQPNRTDPDGTVHPARPEETRCHYFITDGQIIFCDDSKKHDLRGSHPLPECPGDEYGWPPEE